MISNILTKAVCFDTRKVIPTRKCPLRYNNYLIQANKSITGSKIELSWLINDLKNTNHFGLFLRLVTFSSLHCVEYNNIMYSKQNICTWDGKMVPKVDHPVEQYVTLWSLGKDIRANIFIIYRSVETSKFSLTVT